MSGLTDDRNDPRLSKGVDDKPVPQATAYLILTEEERKKGYKRSLRTSYYHAKCGAETWMSLPIAETYAVNPAFYGSTYCTHCHMHLPVAEFRWSVDGSTVGT